jgi:hypothetical protein
MARGFGARRRDLAVAHVAFYSGARGVLKVLDHMLDCSETVTLDSDHPATGHRPWQPEVRLWPHSCSKSSFVLGNALE